LSERTEMDKEEFKNNLQGLINEINRELNVISEKISKFLLIKRDSGTDKRKEAEDVFVNSLAEVMQKVKSEFEKEKKKR
jgi:hypothetical protein